MPSETPIAALPYPLPTEPIADGATAIRELAEALDPKVGVVPALDLPAAPVDGQRAIVVDSLAAPTFAWELIYLAAIADAHKWLYVGGEPLAIRSNADGVSTGNLSLVVPLAGLFTIRHGGQVYGAVQDTVYVSNVSVGGAGAFAQMVYRSQSAAGGMASIAGADYGVAAAAGAAFVQVMAPGAPGRFEYRWLELTPRRLG
jgi:hypothetical protein